jgi:HAD superfamily hydrolase (TIGR01549 family)
LPQPAFKNLIFDLDDTLIGSSALYDLGMAAIGIAPDDPTYLEARRQVKEALGPNPNSHSRVLYFKRMLELSGQYNSKRHLGLVEAYENFMESKICEQWASLGRQELFAELRSKYRCFLLTNETVRMQSLKLRAIDPNFEWFDAMLTSEEAGFEKPDSRMYQLAFDRWEIHPNDSVMIGDSIVNDIEPALKLQMPAIHAREFLKDHSSLQTPQGAHAMEKLDQIVDVLKILDRSISKVMS